MRSFNCCFCRSGSKLQHRHFAGAARPQTFENFNRRRLAGAVRTEQAEDLARVHFEIDSLHRFESAVRFAQALNVNDGLAHYSLGETGSSTVTGSDLRLDLRRTKPMKSATTDNAAQHRAKSSPWRT